MIENNQTNIIKIKPILDHQVKWRCQSQSDIAYITKSTPKMLSNIQLTNIISSKIGNVGIRKLRKALVDNKRASILSVRKTPECQKLHHLLDINNHLKTFNISFDHAEDNIFKKEAIKRLIRLKKYRTLSSLDMNFSCSKFNKDIILQEISKQLKTLPNLRTLKINIRECDKFNWRLQLIQTVTHPDDPSIYLLKLQLPRALSSLDLTFGRGKFPKGDLLEFTSQVQKLTELEHLTLNFTPNTQFKDIGPDEARIWSLLFKKTQNLKTLNIINSIDLWKSLEGTQIFLESLQSPKNLTNLHLDLSLYRAENIIPETLLSSLALIPSFKYLKINLSSRYLDQPKQIQSLLGQIQLFTQLEKLHLDLTECFPRTGNNAVFKGVLQIIQRLTQLKSLEILLSAKDIDSGKAILLVQNLKQLTKLKILRLQLVDFHPNYELIESLSKSISQLNLTSFQLILDPNGQSKPVFQRIASLWKSKKELTLLFLTISGFKELTILNLNLSTFDVSTNESREFSGALKELKQLSSLTLELPQLSSENILEGLQIIVSSLKEIRCLSSLNLSFGRNRLSKEAIRCLESGLGECKSLESLKLDIQHTEKLTLEDIRCLILGWKGLNLLRNFQLELVNMDTTNDEVVELVESMTILKSLEHVKLNTSFERIVSLDLGRVKNFKNFRYLTELILNHRIVF